MLYEPGTACSMTYRDGYCRDPYRKHQSLDPMAQLGQIYIRHLLEQDLILRDLSKRQVSLTLQSLSTHQSILPEPQDCESLIGTSFESPKHITPPRISSNLLSNQNMPEICGENLVQNSQENKSLRLAELM